MHAYIQTYIHKYIFFQFLNYKHVNNFSVFSNVFINEKHISICIEDRIVYNKLN